MSNGVFQFYCCPIYLLFLAIYKPCLINYMLILRQAIMDHLEMENFYSYMTDRINFLLSECPDKESVQPAY